MTRSADLHGSAPDEHEVALVLIDVINDLDFPEGEQLLAFARPMAERIAALKRRARAAGIPCVYVNDNFGRWKSDLRAQIAHCQRPESRGTELVKLLEPAEDDYFVLKPMHSGFYDTTLELLLRHFGTRTVILTGMAGNICVLFTANDAYMRGFDLVVPADCVASNTAEENRYALDQMKRILKADVRPSAEVELTGGSRRPREA